jgi:hypothetical protein
MPKNRSAGVPDSAPCRNCPDRNFPADSALSGIRRGTFTGPRTEASCDEYRDSFPAEDISAVIWFVD